MKFNCIQTVMNQKRPLRSDSPSKQRSDSKKGIFTSLEEQKQKPNVIPYLQQSLQGAPIIHQIRHVYPQVNQTTSTGYINSANIIGSLSQIPIHQSYEVPPLHTPTKVQFHYPGSQQYVQTGSQHVIGQVNNSHQVQYVPIQNRGETQVRQRVIPVHIRNQIPLNLMVNNPNTPAYPPYKAPATQDKNNDQAYQILLSQYEKLYEKLSKQQIYCQDLQTQITQLRRIHSGNQGPTQNQSNTHTRTKYTINIKQLHDKLFKLYKKTVDQAIRKRKQSARAQLREYFASANKEISYSTTEIVESVTKLKWKG